MTSKAPGILTVGLTGLNAHDNPGPGIAVARALKEAYGDSIRLVGLAYEALEPGIYMHSLMYSTYRIPYPAMGHTLLYERLLEIEAETGFDLIIPNFDAELPNFIKIAHKLAMEGIKTFLPDAGQLDARDKTRLNELALKFSFKVPAYINLNTTKDIDDACEQLGYPLFVKGRYYEARLAANTGEARKLFDDIASRWGLPVIAQQYIKGTEINVAGLGDGRGNLVSAVPMRKLYINDKGKAWAGVSIEDAELIDLARNFAAALQWKGGFELEILKDNDGNLFIIEINPRFPAWVYLTAACGQNQPEALVKMAMGEEVRPFKGYEAGKLFIRHSWDEVVDLASFQQFSAFGKI
jgi:carbamoyl-phosphate synthase large subunit